MSLKTEKLAFAKSSRNKLALHFSEHAAILQLWLRGNHDIEGHTKLFSELFEIISMIGGPSVIRPPLLFK